MRSSFAVGGVSMSWDPHTRIFDYEADIHGHAPRHEEERLVEWVRAQAGNQPYGVIVGPASRRSRTSGFSLAEMVQERGRVRVACYGIQDGEALILPMLAAVTGIPIRNFPTREAAYGWLRESLVVEMAALNPSTSATATR